MPRKIPKYPSKYLGCFIGKSGILSDNILAIPTTSVSWPLNIFIYRPKQWIGKKDFRSSSPESIWETLL